MGRREQLLDAAIEVVGTQGMHGLTHRTLDAAAGLPAGSASNHFRTRAALLDAVVERFAERERQNWEALAMRSAPRTPQQLARVLADFAVGATGAHRALTMARYAILVEAGVQPSLRAQLAATGAWVNTWATTWFRIAGSPDPERHAPAIMNHWTGIVLHQLAMPDPAFDPYPQIEAVVSAVVQAAPAMAPAEDTT
ncbi:TetR family transcriptional regulator [Dactylosporangium vinaceum]|nr:TetR family transcriptional regulator [Dactylosporangium vinaceum]